MRGANLLVIVAAALLLLPPATAHAARRTVTLRYGPVATGNFNYELFCYPHPVTMHEVVDVVP